MLALNMGLAVRVDRDVEVHGVAADRAILDVVLVRAGLNVHRHHDLFAAGVADVNGLVVGNGRGSPTTFFAFRHEIGCRMKSVSADATARLSRLLLRPNVGSLNRCPPSSCFDRKSATETEPQQAGCTVVNVLNDDNPYSFHPGGVSAVMDDAAVTFMAEGIDATVFAALVSRDSGEVAAVP